jgi:dTDP-4-dehydrorhamnose reductase
MDPIAGLLHHGSGPAFTDLTDEKFPEKFADYATKVATRFPWINYYTPVNEPLTTARFSGLYGFWYPHLSTEADFLKILVNEMKGTVLAMQAIRKINPSAKLIQTEDLAKTHSTPLLAYQAEYENHRRWLSFDLLCGKVDKNHFFWNYLTAHKIPESTLKFFLDNPCPPSIIGLNYYVTSERYLDEKLENYPAYTHGRNRRHRYADTEATRTGHSSGLEALLREAWDRYHLPIAITECHLSCTREEQIRWFKETWDTCTKLKQEGVSIEAVTAWSLLGAYDWNSLLTEEAKHYESGVFDLSNNKLRPTALAKMLRCLAETGNYDSPFLYNKGWWHSFKNSSLADKIVRKGAPLLIIGKTSELGRSYIAECENRSIYNIVLSRKEVNILDESSIRSAIHKYAPWAIINATDFQKIDDAELKSKECFDVNAKAPALLAKICREYNLRFMTFSSDLVFNGDKRSPYLEDDDVLPLNTYGASKAKGEELTLISNDEALIIRTGAFFGPRDTHNFVYRVLTALKNKEQFIIPKDIMVSPTYVPDLCSMSLDLLIDEEKGIWHLTNDGSTTWADFGDIIADRAGYKKNRLIAKPVEEMNWKARRPLYSVLESGKGIKLPNLDHALDRYFETRTV